jgi:hypothetical protein
MIQTEGALTWVIRMFNDLTQRLNTRAPGQDPARVCVIRDTFFIHEEFPYFYSVFKLKETWNYHIGFTG